MTDSIFNKAKISAICSVLPCHVKNIDTEINLYGGDEKQINRIKKTIGIQYRNVTDDKTTTADLCEYAASIILSNVDIKINDIDCLIFVSQTPDYILPATAAYLHGKINLPRSCAVFDVNLGCSGYVYGLWLSFCLIESGMINNTLLLVGDTISKLVHPCDRASAPLFGDAGSATLVQKTNYTNTSYFSLETDGSRYRDIIVPAGGFRRRVDKGTKDEITDGDGNKRTPENFFMNGMNVFDFSITEVPKQIKHVLELSGKDTSMINYFFLHQANKFIVQNIMRILKIPSNKCPSDITEKFGNSSSASIPVAICSTLGTDMLCNHEYALLSGFGVGLSWASCITKFDDIFISKIKLLEGNINHE